MNKIPFTYNEILTEIWNYPDEFKRVVIRMGYNKYHFYWCKDKSYLNKWRLINDFMDSPEKYTIEYKLGDVVKRKRSVSKVDDVVMNFDKVVNDVVKDETIQLSLF